ncbi:MAG: (2Fe-2S)-binding protein, partial [Deltaproteobacteria bacterium]|nr:(2Fe-2S)-binding protein [Deltaproteobacteria bacterium]
MVNLTIDGKQVSVEEGATIIQAAKKAGIRIPHFCYHQALSIPANCRMCLVETNKSPKPVPSCYELASEGLVVNTKTDSVRDTQKSILEFILLNHPIDCPICDQAGECKLQDYYAEYSLQPSRLLTPKVHKPKAKVIGPNVILDAERCILCTRCVRK